MVDKPTRELTDRELLEGIHDALLELVEAIDLIHGDTHYMALAFSEDEPYRLRVDVHGG